jgi:hypothetical protein
MCQPQHILIYSDQANRLWLEHALATSGKNDPTPQSRLYADIAFKLSQIRDNPSKSWGKVKNRCEKLFASSCSTGQKY